MPYRPKEIETVYWTPAKAAKKFATKQSHLRFIESELGFDVQQIPLRTDWTIRRYTKKEMEIIGKVIHANNLTIPLQVIKRYGVGNLDKIIEFFTGLEK